MDHMPINSCTAAGTQAWLAAEIHAAMFPLQCTVTVVVSNALKGKDPNLVDITSMLPSTNGEVSDSSQRLTLFVLLTSPEACAGGAFDSADMAYLRGTTAAGPKIKNRFVSCWRRISEDGESMWWYKPYP